MNLPNFQRMLREYPRIAVPLSLVCEKRENGWQIETVLCPPGFGKNFLYSAETSVEEALASLDAQLQGMFSGEVV